MQHAGLLIDSMIGFGSAPPWESITIQMCLLLIAKNFNCSFVLDHSKQWDWSGKVRRKVKWLYGVLILKYICIYIISWNDITHFVLILFFVVVVKVSKCKLYTENFDPFKIKQGFGVFVFFMFQSYQMDWRFVIQRGH